MRVFYEKVLDEDIDKILPITYSLSTERNMAANFQFKQIMNKYHNKNPGVWICKPGENANRGRGIRVFNNILKIKSFLQ